MAGAGAIRAATASTAAHTSATSRLGDAGGGIGYGMMGGYVGGGARSAYGMMGGEGGWGGGLGGYGAYGGVSERTVAMGKVTALGNLRPTGATVETARNRVVFRDRDVHLYVVASPSGQKDETFRIAGMVDPTVVVPTGATVHVTFVNADAGMYHDMVVTPARPPFPYMAMMQAPPAFEAGATPMLGPATPAGAEEAQSTFVASIPGRYTYVCLWPGHAQKGMYGTFLVGASQT